MQKSERLNQLESRIATEMEITSVGFNLIARGIAFPINLAGKRTLDIGSGLSPVSVELRRRGAIVIAVDAGYGDIKKLIKSQDKVLNNSYLITPNFDAVTRQYPKRVIQEALSRYVEYSRKNREKFVQDFNHNRESYIPALAGALPFVDDSFDFIFSYSCISRLLGKGEIVDEAIFEALRVVKPGGEVQIYPWKIWLDEEDPAKRADIFRISGRLRERGIVMRAEAIDGNTTNRERRLRLLKPAA